jgi:hypothetical protein
MELKDIFRLAESSLMLFGKKRSSETVESEPTGMPSAEFQGNWNQLAADYVHQSMSPVSFVPVFYPPEREIKKSMPTSASSNHDFPSDFVNHAVTVGIHKA